MIKVHTHPKGANGSPLVAHDAYPIDCTVAELIDWLSKLQSDAQVYVPHLRRRGPVLRVVENSSH